MPLGAALDEIKGRLGDLLDALSLPYHPEKREES